MLEGDIGLSVFPRLGVDLAQVALGNAPTTQGIVAALQGRSAHPSALVREHEGIREMIRSLQRFLATFQFAVGTDC